MEHSVQPPPSPTTDADSVWHPFVRSGAKPPSGTLAPDIAASWERCRAQGVDPFAGRADALLPARDLDLLLARKAELIRIAKPFMQSLYDFVAGLGFVALLFDEQGILLEAMGDPGSLQAPSLLNFSPGACWTEQEIGTNGVGTALAAGHPVQVSGLEHFCRKHHPWTCSGAPIRDEDGSVTGILDLSGPVDKTHLHTLGMVVASAQAIQNAIGVLRRNQDLLRLNSHLASVLRSASNGIIVLDQEGRIRQLNHVSERLLGMTGREAAGLHLPGMAKDPGPLDLLLERGLEFLDRELELTLRGRAIPCFASGRPVHDEAGHRQGVVLSINPIQRLRHMVNRYSGSQAVFHFDDILGRGAALQKAIDQAQRAALDDTHVLLTGESGTGKEMFAQAIHNRSARALGPFIAVNCGAIPRELLESELFGYQDGAFTGARKGGRPGKFELAAGGTLFLDEIGDMPLDQQVSLLRVLQDHTITRLGGDRPIAVDVRIICATHRDLRSEVLRGTFREDLFYRLHVTPIRLPALREHPEDIPLLVEAFLARQARMRPCSAGPGILETLQGYAWPGNVREFQNVMERACQAARSGTLRREHLPEELFHRNPERRAEPLQDAPRILPVSRTSLRERFDQQIREEVLAALEMHQGNISRAARTLGMGRNTLYRKLARLGL